MLLRGIMSKCDNIDTNEDIGNDIKFSWIPFNQFSIYESYAKEATGFPPLKSILLIETN